MLSGKTFRINIGSKDTIDDIKESIEDEQGISVDQQRHVFAGKELKGDRRLYDYNIQMEPNSFLAIVPDPEDSCVPVARPGGQKCERRLYRYMGLSLGVRSTHCSQ